MLEGMSNNKIFLGLYFLQQRLTAHTFLNLLQDEFDPKLAGNMPLFFRFKFMDTIR